MNSTLLSPAATAVRPYSFEPVGMIPEFNALGSHPVNIMEFLDERIKPRLEALNREHHFRRLREYSQNVVERIRSESPAYVGHHTPRGYQRYLSLEWLEALVSRRLCNLEGKRNFYDARHLVHQGHNVLIVTNHTAVLDTYIMYTCLMEEFGQDIPMSFMMSQNFLYVRLTALMTAGGDLFRTFQPKHMERFRKLGGKHKKAAVTMMQQNCQTLRELRSHCMDGGRMICLYPEMNRGTALGEPEPRYLTMLESLQPTASRGRKLYVMPINVTGRNPVIPNALGTNELDTIPERLQVGYGTTYCGAPIELEEVEQRLERFGRSQVTHGILGRTPEGEDNLRYLSLGLAFLTMISVLSPDDKGIYDCPTARMLAKRLQ